MSPAKYAHFVDEGAGYLFVKTLGQGQQGVTQLLHSPTDRQTYVHKQLRGDVIMSPAHPNEVNMHRQHRYIPALIHSSREESSTIWKYCNGRDLACLTNEFRYISESVPEAFLWRCLRQLIEVLDFLHHLTPPVVHRDIYEANVFVHWPSESCEMPDFYLGDFGRADEIPGRMNAWATCHNSMYNDLRAVVDTVRTMASDNSLWPMESGSASSYSQLLSDTLVDLNETAKYHRTKALRHPVDLTTIKDQIEIGSHLAPGIRGDALRWLKPVLDLRPKLYDTRAELFKDTQVVGPWSVALVDPDTLTVIQVEPKKQYTPLPRDPYDSSDPISAGPSAAGAAARGMTFSQYQAQMLQQTANDKAAAVEEELQEIRHGRLLFGNGWFTCLPFEPDLIITMTAGMISVAHEMKRMRLHAEDQEALKQILPCTP